MAATIPNIAKGRINEYAARVKANDPANSALVIALFQSSVSTIGELRDMDTLAAIAAVETEADFTNYARIVLTDSDITAPTPDDDADSMSFDIDDQSIANAGGGSDNTIEIMVVGYDPDTTGGTDADIVPLYVFLHDTGGVTTNGETFWIRINASGLWTAGEA